MLSDALKYQKHGIAVFPLAPNTKIPMKGTSGVKMATTNPVQIKNWWTENPKANVGVAMGQASGIVGIDLDFNHGATEADLAKFPATVTHKSRNGYHIFYKWQPGLKNGATIIEGKDIPAATLRCDGLYFVGVGSVVAWDEKTKSSLEPFEYTWGSLNGVELALGDVDIANLPDWITNLAIPKTSSQSQTTSGSERVAGEKYGANTRHKMFVDTATAMRRKGKPKAEIREELHRRNEQDCDPPKHPFGDECEEVLDWVFKTVEVDPTAIPNGKNSNKSTNSTQNAPEREQNSGDNVDGGSGGGYEGSERVEEEEFVYPLGHTADGYYYTTSSNRRIVTISRTSHSPGALLDLMPREYWVKHWPIFRKEAPPSVHWEQAASELMEQCRVAGMYTESKVRGTGGWHETSKLILHYGETTQKDGKTEPVTHKKNQKYIYPLLPPVEAPDCENPLSNEEGTHLVTVCKALRWEKPESAMLFAGAMAIARLCGALSWRPHIWLTGGSGTGKTTVQNYLVANILGDWAIHALGDTTAAGLRQQIGYDARPVIFDEAETSNRKSSNRIQGIIELARQGSSDTEARIFKGTPDGKGHFFRISCMFIMSSIRVNLTEQQDINRFTVMELLQPDPKEWPKVEAMLKTITPEFGRRLFGRMVNLYQPIMASTKVFENAISKFATRRNANQYGILLASYWHLGSERVVTEDEAKNLVQGLATIKEATAEQEESGDPVDCLETLLSNVVPIGEIPNEPNRVSIQHLVRMASETAVSLYQRELDNFGLSVGIPKNGERMLYVKCKNNTGLAKLYSDTQWCNGTYSRALARLPGADKAAQHKFEGKNRRCVAIPLQVVFPPEN